MPQTYPVETLAAKILPDSDMEFKTLLEIRAHLLLIGVHLSITTGAEVCLLLQKE